MKLKFNWGTGIFIFLILFFIAIFWFVFFSLRVQQDLVDDDYYPKELEYEEQIKKQENLLQLAERITARKEGDWLIIQFPSGQKEEAINGQILAYRPSDSRLDKTFTIQLDSLNKQKLDISGIRPGKYILKIGWTYQNKAFYQEIPIIF